MPGTGRKPVVFLFYSTLAITKIITVPNTSVRHSFYKTNSQRLPIHFYLFKEGWCCPFPCVELTELAVCLLLLEPFPPTSGGQPLEIRSRLKSSQVISKEKSDLVSIQTGCYLLYHDDGSKKLNPSSYTWFIFNLNTKHCYSQITYFIYTCTDVCTQQR